MKNSTRQITVALLSTLLFFIIISTTSKAQASFETRSNVIFNSLDEKLHLSSVVTDTSLFRIKSEDHKGIVYRGYSNTNSTEIRKIIKDILDNDRYIKTLSHWSAEGPEMRKNYLFEYRERKVFIDIIFNIRSQLFTLKTINAKPF
jgi:hypothetical protein